MSTQTLKFSKKIANCIKTFKIKSENKLVANPCIRDFSNRFLNGLHQDNLSFLLLFRVFLGKYKKGAGVSQSLYEVAKHLNVFINGVQIC